VLGRSLLRLFNRRGATGNAWSRGGSPLTGSFELRVDRIVGWATDNQGSRADSMRIEVTRGESVIATCQATPRRERERFDFTFDIEDRFTSKELVLETVKVIALDSSGNRGVVRLDGATQLELIRDHLGVPVDVVLDLEFGTTGNAGPHLGAGWSTPEPNARWTENDDSFISLDTPAEPGTYALRFTATPLLREPDLRLQPLVVFVNDWQVANIAYVLAHAQFQECRFPHEAFGAAPRATLRFHHPGAVRIADLIGNQDQRRLAFSFKRMTVVRLLQPD